MKILEVREAVAQAERDIRAANNCIDDMARLIRGKLRSADVNTNTLSILKKELRDFNIHTGQWSEK